MDADFGSKSNACVCRLDNAVQFICNHGHFHSVSFLFATHAIHVTSNFLRAFFVCQKESQFQFRKKCFSAVYFCVYFV